MVIMLEKLTLPDTRIYQLCTLLEDVKPRIIIESHGHTC